jgi:uncharacterized protein YutE (UPF0331/DUF86 family)
LLRDKGVAFHVRSKASTTKRLVFKDKEQKSAWDRKLKIAIEAAMDSGLEFLLNLCSLHRMELEE